jgi:putative ABC transport system permease protein
MSGGGMSLTAVDIGLAALLLAINAGLSLAFRLGLAKDLIFSAIRMVAQLSLVGFVLRYVFQSGSLWLTLSAALIEVGQRQRPRFRGFVAEGLGLVTLLVVGTISTLYAVGVVIGPTVASGPGLLTSFEPRHVLPILGMILGNTLTAVSLSLATLVDLAQRERGAIEAQLALGVTRHEAFQRLMQSVLRTAMMPIINAMAVTGLVTLPGMMTGQILAGADPTDAAKAQMMIMFVISGAAGLGAFAAVLGGVRLLTDKRHRLRLDVLVG